MALISVVLKLSITTSELSFVLFVISYYLHLTETAVFVKNFLWLKRFRVERTRNSISGAGEPMFFSGIFSNIRSYNVSTIVVKGVDISSILSSAPDFIFYL